MLRETVPSDSGAKVNKAGRRLVGGQGRRSQEEVHRVGE